MFCLWCVLFTWKSECGLTFCTYKKGLPTGGEFQGAQQPPVQIIVLYMDGRTDGNSWRWQRQIPWRIETVTCDPVRFNDIKSESLRPTAEGPPQGTTLLTGMRRCRRLLRWLPTEHQLRGRPLVLIRTKASPYKASALLLRAGVASARRLFQQWGLSKSPDGLRRRPSTLLDSTTQSQDRSAHQWEDHCRGPLSWWGGAAVTDGRDALEGPLRLDGGAHHPQSTTKTWCYPLPHLVDRRYHFCEFDVKTRLTERGWIHCSQNTRSLTFPVVYIYCTCQGNILLSFTYKKHESKEIQWNKPRFE